MSKHEINKALLLNGDESLTEAQRKKKINEDWWKKKEAISWRAYFIKGTIDEWEAEDNMFRTPLEKFLLFAQKLVFLVWKFLPWILICLPSWRYESLYYLFYIALSMMIAKFINFRYNSSALTFQINNFVVQIWKLSRIFYIP